MTLILNDIHKNHLMFLTKQSVEVLKDFCKLALDYINKGPNSKMYQTASERLQVDYMTIQNSVESIVFLLVESCRQKLNKHDFLHTVLEASFSEEQAQILFILYSKKQTVITENLIDDVPPYFRDLEWRFEAKVGSRALLHQMTPLVTMHLKVSDSPKAGTGTVNSALLQTDANTLLHITSSLEKALQDMQTLHMKTARKRIEN